MKVLVTGATGFIGSALCRRLCEDGHTVEILRRQSSSMAMLNGLPVRSIIGDLGDESSIEAAVSQRPEVIFHIGALMVCGRNVSRLLGVNVTGTRNLLNAAIKYGVSRVIFMSTALTMGIPENSDYRGAVPVPINENHCWNGDPEIWPCTWTKVLAEREVQLACAEGLDAAIVNPCFVIGAGDHYRRKSSWFVQMKRKPPRFSINGGINVIPVKDVVQGLLNANQYGKRGERYVLSGKNIPFRELINLYAEIAGFPKPSLMMPDFLIRKSISMIGRSTFVSEEQRNSIYYFAGRFFYYDPRKARLDLHLPPSGDLRIALTEMSNWFKMNP